MHSNHSLCLLALLLGALFALAGSAGAQPALSPELRAQIDSLVASKRARTPVQQKLASRLLFAEDRARGFPLAPGLARIRSGVETDAEGRVLLDIEGEITTGLLRHLSALGGSVVTSLPERGALRAWLPLLRVTPLAARGEVRRVAPAGQAFTHKNDTSEGDGAHYADDARSVLGIDGSGVTVGVLSDGVCSLADLQTSGDLPAVTVLPGQAGPTCNQAIPPSEGTAMLEIVFDLAPGADLLFATAFTGQAAFANNIVALRNAGADVIVDDVGYFAEAAFQDDDVAAAVDQVVADGALYFSAAGNSGNLNDGTAGVYEGDFVPGANFAGVPQHAAPRPAHDYGAGDILNQITLDSPFLYTLHWSDPLGASGNDYDLYMVDAAGSSIVAYSNDTQNGNDDPYELVNSQGNDTGNHLVVVRYSGANRFFHLNAHRGRLEHSTEGQVWGHAAARGAVAVAAVDARSRASGFLGNEPVESYSSDGPRRVFFEANGTAITPGDFSSSGGEVREVPDLAGADCVDTHTPGFNIFCGTSAAAPHLAALAALLLEDAGGPGVVVPANVLGALESTALDIEAAGPDRDSGAGIAHARNAAEALCSVDLDCDDGVFCNGAEACLGGSCVAGSPPACQGATPFCDESAQACVECLGSGDCDDALFCNGAESCAAGACQGGTPPVCEAPTPFCDEGADACVECLGSGDCDDALFCNGAESCAAGACQGGTPPVCEAPTPFCDEVADTCSVCLVAGDCDDGLFCNGAEACSAGACAPGSPPSCDPPTPFCDEGADACAECLANGDCDDALFCTGEETCVGGACQPDAGPVCEAPTPFCEESLASCVECQTANDCPQPSGGCSQGVCLDPPVPVFSGRLGPLWWTVIAVALLGVGVALGSRDPQPRSQR